MTSTSRDALFEQLAADLGHDFSGEMRIGGNYVPAIRNGDEVYVSGQIPRVADSVVVTGRVGAETSLEQARAAARICVMRALAILRQLLGSLDAVGSILRITVYVQSGPDFVQQSEVADAASEVLYAVLGPCGAHTRTSVGVCQLPKNASVELDLIAGIAAVPR
jgi:enamine deaminase RidA (YjgF/YER057c/UK114 family)